MPFILCRFYCCCCPLLAVVILFFPFLCTARFCILHFSAFTPHHYLLSMPAVNFPFKLPHLIYTIHSLPFLLLLFSPSRRRICQSMPWHLAVTFCHNACRQPLLLHSAAFLPILLPCCTSRPIQGSSDPSQSLHCSRLLARVVRYTVF